MNTMQNLTRKSLGGSLSSSLRRSGAAAAAAGQRRSYHDNIVEHYENPRNVGSLDKKDKFVGTVSRPHRICVKTNFVTSKAERCRDSSTDGPGGAPPVFHGRCIFCWERQALVGHVVS